jgi:hypothetical protein
MGDRRRGRVLKGGTASLLLLFLLTVVLPGCRKAAAPGPQAGSRKAEKAPAATPPRPDPALDRLFYHIAGLPDPAGRPWPEDVSWTAFAGSIAQEWASFGRTVLEPMKDWAGTELREARKDTESLFYPFGGPDFVTAYTLFPEVRETVLLGLEQVGNLPDLSRAPAAWREAFYADLGDLVAEFLKRGYFITKDMTDVYGRGKVDGALSVIAFFLARGGYSVAAVTRLAPDGKGGWAETPYARLGSRPHRPYGARIVYLAPGESEPRSVVYFSCDIEDKAFPPGSPLYGFFAGLERMTTFVKSGSYLLQYNDFSTLRDFILGRSLFVLQDDTAVPYRYFKNGGWEIRLFGQYATPVKDFSNVEQPALRQAYEADGSSVAPLPFKFGYHWRSQADNLMLAKRPHRLYKTPVDR